MKKKFRNIIIDGDDSWTWRVKDSGNDYYYIVNITIWKGERPIHGKADEWASTHHAQANASR